MGKFCTNCGAKIEEGQEKCLSCGKVLVIKPTKEVNTSNENTTTNNNSTTNNNNPGVTSSKSKVCAGLLAIFVGAFGIHNFYLGYTGKAVAQLLLTLIGWILCGLGPLIAGVWGFVEGIMILTGSISKDASGNNLVD